MGVVGWFDANLVSILDGVAWGLLLFTLAAGLSLVFGMMDVLNLAHGTLYLLGGVIVHLLGGGWIGFALAVLAGIVLGAASGGVLTLLTQPLAGRGHLDQALLTLGVALIGAEAFAYYSGGQTLRVEAPEAVAHSISLFGHAYPVYRLLFIGIAALIALLVYLTFDRSILGALVRATVADREMVQAMGVDTRKVLLGVFAFGAALATLGGVLGTPIIQASPGVDDQILVLSLVVIVIGGLGSVRGALIGALFIGQVQSLGPVLAADLAAFLLFGSMLLVLAIRPQGLASVVKQA